MAAVDQHATSSRAQTSRAPRIPANPASLAAAYQRALDEGTAQANAAAAVAAMQQFRLSDTAPFCSGDPDALLGDMLEKAHSLTIVLGNIEDQNACYLHHITAAIDSVGILIALAALAREAKSS